MAHVKRLAEDLRALDLQVWLDDDEIRPGDSIVGRMNEGLEGAGYLVLCYSKESIDSPWASREWMSALARQLNDSGIKIIPVRFPSSAPPAILADIKYADFSADWEAGLRDLTRVLMR